jgi:hypothetical protein
MSVTHEVVNKALVLTVRGVSTPSDVTAAFDAALADTSLDVPNGVLIDTRQAIARLNCRFPGEHARRVSRSSSAAALATLLIVEEGEKVLMSVIDFNDIASVNLSAGAPEAFELFTREFLEMIGFRIISGPDRGADSGRDLVAEEIRTGVGGQTFVRWLISCKHKAATGRAVLVGDEHDIGDRVKSNGCSAFLGFYSTIPSSSLVRKLEGLSERLDWRVFDRDLIERHLLSSQHGILLAQRYFATSMADYKREHPIPARLFTNPAEIQCQRCRKNLLEPNRSGIVVSWEDVAELDRGHRKIVHFYWCCKGSCDDALKHLHRGSGLVDGWVDISDVAIPTVYLRWIMATFNELNQGVQYSSEAFRKLKLFMIGLGPYVVRELTSEEREQIDNLLAIPSFIGGMG